MGIISLVAQWLQPLIIFGGVLGALVILWGRFSLQTGEKKPVGKWLVGAMCLIIGLSIGIPLLFFGAFVCIGSLVNIGRDATGLGWIFVFFILPPGLGISALLIPAVRLLGLQLKQLAVPIALMLLFHIFYWNTQRTHGRPETTTIEQKTAF